jgi:hypothetical protein
MQRRESWQIFRRKNLQMNFRNYLKALHFAFCTENITNITHFVLADHLDTYTMFCRFFGQSIEGAGPTYGLVRV